jgi:hypothetical protein
MPLEGELLSLNLLGRNLVTFLYGVTGLRPRCGCGGPVTNDKLRFLISGRHKEKGGVMIDLGFASDTKTIELVEGKRARLRGKQRLVLMMQTWYPQFNTYVVEEEYAERSDDNITQELAERSHAKAQSSLRKAFEQQVIIFHSATDEPTAWQEFRAMVAEAEK